MDKFIPTDEQWEKMKKHIRSDKYKKEDFFVFETLAVGDKIVPNRYLRLTPELLEVMKQDAIKGVSLMLNHNWDKEGVQSIPIGKVFDARIAESSQDGETVALYTTQYILRDDNKVDGYSKNDIIRLIETGTISDTSVGWGTTTENYKCSICGNSIYDFRHCEHIPGKKYIINQETNEVRQCIILAKPPTELHAGNNVLMENSLVFDGAYPNAIIQSAVADGIETSHGKLKCLDSKIELSNKDIIFGYSFGKDGINLLYKENNEKGGFGQMDNENVEEIVNDEVTNTEETNAEETNTQDNNTTQVEKQENLNDNDSDANITEDLNANKDTELENTSNNKDVTMYSEKDILEKFGNIANNIDQLVTLAKEGKEARQEVIEQALKSGVRMSGNSFNKEIFEQTFSNMETKAIKAMGEAWEEQVKAEFSTKKVSKQDFKNNNFEDMPRISFEQFKTDIY